MVKMSVTPAKQGTPSLGIGPSDSITMKLGNGATTGLNLTTSIVIVMQATKATRALFFSSPHKSYSTLPNPKLPLPAPHRH